MPLTPPSNIYLYGRLRRKFGHEFRLSVPTAAHAAYALIRTQPGFRDELVKGQYRIVRGSLGKGLDLDENMTGLMLAGLDLHIIPVARGRGRSGGGIAKIVLGVAFVALAAVTAGGAFGAAAGFAGLGTAVPVLGISAGAVGLLGAGLIFSGVGSILSQVPKPVNPRASFLLSGPINTTAQGGPVPLAYGTLVRVGSTVISSGYDATALSANPTTPQTASSGSNPIESVNLGVNLVGGATGGVSQVTVQNQGVGYTTATVSFVSTNGGTGAEAHAIVTSGFIVGIVVDAPGSGYAGAPHVVITGDGTGASALATVTTTA